MGTKFERVTPLNTSNTTLLSKISKNKKSQKNKNFFQKLFSSIKTNKNTNKNTKKTPGVSDKINPSPPNHPNDQTPGGGTAECSSLQPFAGKIMSACKEILRG